MTVRPADEAQSSKRAQVEPPKALIEPQPAVVKQVVFYIRVIVLASGGCEIFLIFFSSGILTVRSLNGFKCN